MQLNLCVEITFEFLYNLGLSLRRLIFRPVLVWKGLRCNIRNHDCGWLCLWTCYHYFFKWSRLSVETTFLFPFPPPPSSTFPQFSSLFFCFHHRKQTFSQKTFKLKSIWKQKTCLAYLCILLQIIYFDFFISVQVQVI